MTNEERLAEIEGRAAKLLSYFGPRDKCYATTGLKVFDYLVQDICDDDIPWLVARVRALEAQVADTGWAYCQGCTHLYNEERADVAELRIRELEVQAARDAAVVEAADRLVVALNRRGVYMTFEVEEEQAALDAALDAALAAREAK